MRNPLTVSLVAMAIHTGFALAMLWPYPSIATFVTGIVAVVGAVMAPRAPPRATGGLAAMALFLPGVVPYSLVLAGGAAILGSVLVPRRGAPLQNLVLTVPAVTLLTVGITL